MLYGDGTDYSIPPITGGPGTATAPPVTPYQPPTDSVQTGYTPGYTPDYSTLLKSDPSYLAALAASNQSAASAQAQRQATIRSLIVRYGAALPNFTDKFGDVDQATLDAASKNQNSIMALLKYNYGQGVEQMHQSLAARGMLQSGELAHSQDALDRGLSQQEYDTGNQLTDSINQALNQYTGVLDTNAKDMASAISAAEQDVFANPAYQPTAATSTSANYDANLSYQYGAPIYTDGSGAMYDLNGNPFAPSASNPVYRL